jgi:hypothetical protein
MKRVWCYLFHGPSNWYFWQTPGEIVEITCKRCKLDWSHLISPTSLG